MRQIASPSRTRLVALIGGVAVLYALAGCSKSGAELKSTAKGDMAALTLSASPAPAPDTVFRDAAGKPHTLAEFKGKAVLVNLWANWCTPCKAEIPSLARLAAAYAGKPLAIVPISVGKGADETAGHAFLDKNPPLTFYTEPTYTIAFALKPPAEGMPTTILYDSKGVERARLAGGADWSGPDAHATIDALMTQK